MYCWICKVLSEHVEAITDSRPVYCQELELTQTTNNAVNSKNLHSGIIESYEQTAGTLHRGCHQFAVNVFAEIHPQYPP